MILAIDPGLRNTGWAVMDRGSGSVHSVGLIQTTMNKSLPRYLDNAHCMTHIADKLRDVLDDDSYEVEYIVFEAKSGSKSAKAAAAMAMAQGVVASFSAGVLVNMYCILATEVKRRLGVDKNLGKRAVADTIIQHYSMTQDIEGMITKEVGGAFGRQEHIYDAIAIGLACLQREEERYEHE